MSTYYEGLPIYKATTDVVVLLDKVVRGFSRYHKYTLGSRMRETAIDIVMLVARANRREERARLLPELCHRADDLRLLVNPRKGILRVSIVQSICAGHGAGGERLPASGRLAEEHRPTDGARTEATTSARRPAVIGRAQHYPVRSARPAPSGGPGIQQRRPARREGSVPSNPGLQAALAAAHKKQADVVVALRGRFSNAWTVHFNNGNVNNNNVDNTFRVRCVR